MARLLTILTLILSIVLFPPTALALISNNAVAGDATYPIKRGLEEVILKIASIHPTTKSWFSIERSNRRFEEATILLTRGTKATETLDELVVQTESVAREIAQIKDPVRKQELTEKLHKEIQKYDEGLEKVKEEITPRAPVATAPLPTLTPSPKTPKPSPASPSRLQSPPQPTPTPARVVHSPPPSVIIPSATPQITPSPTPSPPPAIDRPPDTEDIDRTRDRLRDIREGLSAAAQDRGRDHRDNNENRGKREEGENRDRSEQEERQRSDEGSDRKDRRDGLRGR